MREFGRIGGGLDRWWAIANGGAALAIMLTSSLSIGSGRLDEVASTALGVAYVAATAWLFADPDQQWLQRFGFIMAVAFWGRRTIAFVLFIFETDRHDLWGTVATHIAILIMVSTLHLMAVRRHAYQVITRAAVDGGT